VRLVLWTLQAREDLAAIRAFINQDSPHAASVVVARLVAATDRIAQFPESGRTVPEFESPSVREVIHHLYRIVYRLVDGDEIHILTVHHGARRFPESL
jgi:plasmid stabilization system protein ParE